MEFTKGFVLMCVFRAWPPRRRLQNHLNAMVSLSGQYLHMDSVLYYTGRGVKETLNEVDIN